MFEEAHARACEQRRWVLNEKRILSGADLEAASELLATAGRNGRAEPRISSAGSGVELARVSHAQTRIAAASRLAVPPVIAAISALDSGSERTPPRCAPARTPVLGASEPKSSLPATRPAGRPGSGAARENGRQVGEDAGMGLDQIEGIVDGREPAVGDDHDRLRVAAGDGRDRSQLGAVGLPGRGMAGVDHDRQPDLGHDLQTSSRPGSSASKSPTEQCSLSTRRPTPRRPGARCRRADKAGMHRRPAHDGQRARLGGDDPARLVQPVGDPGLVGVREVPDLVDALTGQPLPHDPMVEGIDELAGDRRKGSDLLGQPAGKQMGVGVDDRRRGHRRTSSPLRDYPPGT